MRSKTRRRDVVRLSGHNGGDKIRSGLSETPAGGQLLRRLAARGCWPGRLRRGAREVAGPVIEGAASITSSVDISPLVTGSLAVWARSRMPEEQWEPTVY
jgi:hypothetical protein